MAIIDKSANFMGLPMNIARGNPMALDTTEIWYSLSELEKYAKSGATAYVGQIVQLVDEENKTATAYIIANVDGDLVEVGSSTLGDQKTIELGDDGILRLVGAKDAVVGAQLVMGDNGTITWVKPDTTTVEGLNTAVDALQKSVQGHENRLTTAESDIDALQATLAGMGGIFNFAGAITTDDLANTKAEDYDAGDVILVDGVREYVCVETVNDGTSTKRWEVLGDPSGVEALQGKVSALETWKESASSSIDSLNTDVDKAKTDISNLNTSVSDLTTSVNSKASQSDLDLAKADITANANSIKDINSDIEGINTALDTKATIAYVDGKASELQGNIDKKADQETVNTIINTYATDAELESGLNAKVDKTAYNEKITALETADSSNATAIANVKATAEKAASDVSSLTTVVEGKASAQSVSDLATRVGTNETNISANTTAINGLNGTLTGLQNSKADKTAVDDLTTRVADTEQAISDHEQAYNTLKGRVDDHDAAIEKAQGDATQALSDATAANTAASNAQSKADAAMDKANEVLGTAEDTADANTVYGAKAAAAAAQSKADTAQDEVDALEKTVSDLKTALETADSGLSDRISDLEEVMVGVQGAMHFIGVSVTDPSSGVISITGKDDYVPENGDVIIYKDEDANTIEYIYSDGVWVELGDVSAEAKRIGVLESDMATVKTAVAKIPDIEKDIEEINTAKSALEARIKANEEAIAAHTTQITGLDTRLTQAEKDIVQNATDIRAELKAKAEALESAISAEATARDSAVTNLQNQINVINGQLTWTKLTSV